MVELMNSSKNKWYKYLYFSNGIWIIGLVIFVMIGTIFVAKEIPLNIKLLIENYDNIDIFKKQLFILLILFISEYIIRFSYQLLVNKYVQGLILYVRTLCYKKWIRCTQIWRQEDTDEDRYPLGEVLSRIMNDSEAIRELMSSGTMGIFIDLVFIISLMISFIKLNTTSGIFIFIAEICAAGLLMWGSRWMASIFYKVRQANGMLARVLADCVKGLPKIYYNQHHNFAQNKVSRFATDFLTKQLRANIWDASYYSFAESLFPLFLIFITIILPYSNITEIALIVVIFDLIQRSINPIKNVASKMANIQRALSGIKRIREFNDDLDNYQEQEQNIVSNFGSVKCVNVAIDSFKYDDDFSITNVKFMINRGELVGIVGPSGGGKSTVLKIISGIISPDRGKIEIFDDNHKSLVFSKTQQLISNDYRKQVSIVSQDSHIFTGTLIFNISLEENIDFIKFNEFWLFISNTIFYLQSWDIDLRQLIRPEDLSLGQKQLISGIRALYLKRSLVLFDEISSGLDSKLEEALRDVILLLQKQSLTIIVAHRIETIMKADKILVMDAGKLECVGLHKDLLLNSDLYRKFVRELQISKV